MSNHAMQRLLIQTKPAISQPGDQFEQEADRVADQVMRMPEPQLPDGSADGTEITPIAAASVQRACKECEEEEGSGPPVQRKCATCEEDLQRQPVEEEEEETIQTKKASDRAPDITPDVQARLNGLRGGGQPLPNSVRTFFEPRFGRDFSSVRVHTGHEASALAQAVKARAFTKGNNVVFRSSEYMPGTTAGNRLLAHELTHVVQQGHANQLNSVQRSVEPESADRAANIQRTPLVTQISYRSSEGSIQRKPAQCNADNNEGFPQIDKNSPIRDATGYAQRKLNVFMRDFDFHRAEAEKINPAAATFMDKERAKIKPPKAPENADDALDVDCDFGINTTAATKAFQAAMFPNSTPTKQASPQDSAWDGIIGPLTWPKLESNQPIVRVTIEWFFYGNEHGELLDNQADWSSSGTKYSQTNPKQVRFVPFIGDLLYGESDPISLTARSTISGLAKVNVQSGAPGTVLSLTVVPSGPSLPAGERPAWSLSGSLSIDGPGVDFIFLTASGPLPSRVRHRTVGLDWNLAINQNPAELIAVSDQEAFVIVGKPTDVSTSDHKPTHKRMTQAIEFGRPANSLRPDKITHQVMKVYDRYGPCDAPKDPRYRTCPDVTDLWEVSEHPRVKWQCITISRYAAAVLNVLGVPSRFETQVKAVLISAAKADPEVAIEDVSRGMYSDPAYCYPGYPAVWVSGSPTCPTGPGWVLGLIDGRGRANNFEACTKLRWNSPDGWVCQYFCGGAPSDRPLGDFSCPQQILHAVFEGMWYAVTPYDPSDDWPAAEKKRKVGRTYSGPTDSCSQADIDKWCK